jgi:hypothetical protein
LPKKFLNIKIGVMEKVPQPENDKSVPIESLDLAENELTKQEQKYSAQLLSAMKGLLSRKFPNPENLMITEVEDELL